ncbi:hypothetical protein, partial [Microcoleus sp. herbarium7]
ARGGLRVLHDFRKMVLLQSIGGGAIEETDYGFLMTLDGVLIDCEPCVRVGENYELEGLPAGTCP